MANYVSQILLWTNAKVALIERADDDGMEKTAQCVSGAQISFDDVIVLIQPWYNFFANGHM